MSKKPKQMTYIGIDIQWGDVYLDGELTKYKVSNIGDVMNFDTGKVLVQIEDKYGYNQVCLSHKSKHHSVTVHRLVALAFIPNDDPEHKTQVNHEDGKKYNNYVGNLTWTTPKENTIHAYKTGLHDNVALGENHGQNKYNESTIHDICKLLEKGHSMKEVSDITGVPKSTIQDIYHGMYWKHISKYYDFSKVKKKQTTNFNVYKDKIIYMHKCGKTARDICNSLNIKFNDYSRNAINYYKRYCYL